MRHARATVSKTLPICRLDEQSGMDIIQAKVIVNTRQKLCDTQTTDHDFIIKF